MGSYNQSCNISNLTIKENDSCYCIILIKDKNRTTAYSEISLSEYIPFGFPILGEYNGFGNLKNIEKNKNTEVFEKHFGLPIEVLIKQIQTKEIKISSDVILELSFAHKEIYEELICNYKEYETHDFFKDSINLFRTLNVAKMGKRELFEFKMKELKQDYHDYTDEMADLIYETYGEYISSNFLTINENINYPKIVNPSVEYFYEEYLKQYTFLILMYNLYRPLIPSFYGGQYNNYNDALRLNTIINQFLTIKQKSYE